MVSVCIQTYQHVSYIAECLNSVVGQQTNFHIEIIVGEDGSTDGTREICIDFAARFPSIRLFLRNREDVIYVNGKPTGRFNLIENLKVARGKYIALLEGDDYWCDSYKLQKQVDFLESNLDCVLCHHWHRVAEKGIDGQYVVRDAPTLGHGYFPEEKATVDKVFANLLRVKSRTLMFRNVLSKFPCWFYKVAYGDVPLSMILGQYGAFGFINEPMAVYRLTNSGVSTQGASSWWYTFTHYIEWIRIWEYGSNFYAPRYREQAKTTTLSFYRMIFEKYRYHPHIVLSGLQYLLLGSKFPTRIRIQLFYEILRHFLFPKGLTFILQKRRLVK